MGLLGLIPRIHRRLKINKFPLSSTAISSLTIQTEITNVLKNTISAIKFNAHQRCCADNDQ